MDTAEGIVIDSRKFDPKKLAKLNDPKRLEYLNPEVILVCCNLPQLSSTSRIVCSLTMSGGCPPPAGMQEVRFSSMHTAGRNLHREQI